MTPPLFSVVFYLGGWERARTLFRLSPPPTTCVHRYPLPVGELEIPLGIPKWDNRPFGTRSSKCVQSEYTASWPDHSLFISWRLAHCSSLTLRPSAARNDDTSACSQCHRPAQRVKLSSLHSDSRTPDRSENLHAALHKSRGFHKCRLGLRAF